MEVGVCAEMDHVMPMPHNAPQGRRPNVTHERRTEQEEDELEALRYASWDKKHSHRTINEQNRVKTLSKKRSLYNSLLEILIDNRISDTCVPRAIEIRVYSLLQTPVSSLLS